MRLGLEMDQARAFNCKVQRRAGAALRQNISPALGMNAVFVVLAIFNGLRLLRGPWPVHVDEGDNRAELSKAA